MAGVVIRDVVKKFGSVRALTGIDLEVDVGELLAVLGPSGSGKSTLLRTIAGLEKPDRGEIWLGSDCAFSASSGHAMAASDRDVGFVFQSFALYPHMNVYKNVAFGLSIRGESKAVIDQRVRGALELVELTGLERRMPKELSGGQQQRVAVARTLVTLPRIMLFDEPLSNLDPVLRSMMRKELRALNRKTGITFIYVTHDSTEAMILGDRIAVLDEGRIVDVAPPRQVYRFPQTATSASLTGHPKTNLIIGEIRAAEDAVYLLPQSDPYAFISVPNELAPWHGHRLTLHARPEDLTVSPELSETSGRLQVLAVMPDGSNVDVHLNLPGERDHIVVHGSSDEMAGIRPNDQVHLHALRGNLYDHRDGFLLGSFGPALPESRAG
ncbi:MAG: ATP-binding cassette domain-containing protein [Spirochaetes bacterium]|jgi:ABC-type sugar transport system ATPase subunit|nr:ATP-binding cassette domain-containing protein [Spirochaetota bacterium]